ncbi:hypothetical protein ElyMa_006885500 [Elysia marginata]|uniref:Transmembrane protein n=1 Tax=Elysia marginata TaxID=1093978 RepID=A0AAV4JDR2_9GAST|nr:hypothetical protein ElyMa_006885500 [Elysia marginata]
MVKFKLLESSIGTIVVVVVAAAAAAVVVVVVVVAVVVVAVVLREYRDLDIEEDGKTDREEARKQSKRMIT